jgi:hypothetical protein
MKTKYWSHSLQAVLLGWLFASGSGAAEYTLDFRNHSFDNRRLRLIGTGATSLLKPASEGLSVALPAGTNLDEVGFAPRFRLRGDFQITLDYRISELTRPKQGYGVGPGIYVMTASEDRQAATLGRVFRVKEGHVFTAHHARESDGDSPRQQSVRFFDTDTDEGQLRLERIGSRLQYSVAGSDGSWRMLHETEFTDGDVTLARIALNRNGAGDKIPATVVFRSAVIRADRFVGDDDEFAMGWLALALLVLVLGGLSAAGVWLVRKRKGRAW